MKEGFLQVPTSSGTMRAFFTHPEEAGPFPVVVFYMDFWGIREELFDLARRVAVNGYYCVVPDFYYRQGIVLNQVRNQDGKMVSLIKLDPAIREKVLAPLEKLLDSDVVSDTGALLDFLKQQPAAHSGAKGCVGFCLGGRLVLRVGSRFSDEFKASASLHGSSLISEKEDSPHFLASTLRGELYCGFAEHDPFAPPATISAIAETMKQGQASYRYEVHLGAEHGYALPDRDIYDRRAAFRDWEIIMGMFDRQLLAPVREKPVARSRIAFSRLDKATWEKKGLRSFLEYRDLGVAEATEGRFGANVGRALHAFKRSADAPLHYHTIRFHFMYVLRGTTRTYMDGLGDVVMNAGDCVTYQGEIPQAHTEYSADYEVLQVTMPAEYPTVEIVPKAR
jgi:carboxymethylenebutenolidase